MAQKKWVEVIAEDVAMELTNEWIDTHDHSPKVKISLNQMAERIAEAVQYGYVVFNPDGGVFQNLRNPLKDKLSGNDSIVSFNYKPRPTAEEANKALEKLDVSTTDKKIFAYALMLTGTPKEIINKLEGFDRRILESICLVFF